MHRRHQRLGGNNYASRGTRYDRIHRGSLREAAIGSAVLVGFLGLIAAGIEAGELIIGKPMQTKSAQNVSRVPEKGADCTAVKYGAGATGKSVMQTFHTYNPNSNEPLRLRAIVGIAPGESAAGRTVHFCLLSEVAVADTDTPYKAFDIYSGAQTEGHPEISQQQFALEVSATK